MTNDINILIIYVITGAVMLATGYHSVFYFNNRTPILRSYSIYLLTIFLYCLFCVLRLHRVIKTESHFWDELLQMLCCIMYARFLSIAISLSKEKNPWSVRFVNTAPLVVLVYLIGLFITLQKNSSSVLIWMGGIRIYFFIIGSYLLYQVLKQKRSLFKSYLGAGAAVLIVFAILSTLVEYYFLNGHPVRIRGLTWLLAGFFIEIIFFSAAVGYRTKRDNLQRVLALQKVVDQYDIIKNHEIEKLQAGFQSREEERNRIVKDIHDEIGSTVSAISILANVMQQNKLPGELDAITQEIRTNANSLTEKVDDIVWSLNSHNDRLRSLLLRIQQFATPLFEARNINYRFFHESLSLEMELETRQRQAVYYILKEAVNNLLKYANCTNVEIRVESTPSKLLFAISDDGDGFDSKNAPAGNGLHFMKQRAESIGAQLSIESEIKKGTRITLVLNIE